MGYCWVGTLLSVAMTVLDNLVVNTKNPTGDTWLPQGSGAR